MLHRKWRETKQQLILWPYLALLGCRLVSLHFQCDILAPITVQFVDLKLKVPPQYKLVILKRNSYFIANKS